MMHEREKVIKGLEAHEKGCGYRSHHCDAVGCPYRYGDESCDIEEMCGDAIALLKEQQQYIWELQDQVEYLTDKLKEQEADKNKYEYKYDHTDCLWYGSGNCPSTCSQYRDGWNDAMDYIFKDGKGYQPYEGR